MRGEVAVNGERKSGPSCADIHSWMSSHVCFCPTERHLEIC